MVDSIHTLWTKDEFCFQDRTIRTHGELLGQIKICYQFSEATRCTKGFSWFFCCMITSAGLHLERGETAESVITNYVLTERSKFRIVLRLLMRA